MIFKIFLKLSEKGFVTKVTCSNSWWCKPMLQSYRSDILKSYGMAVSRPGGSVNILFVRCAGISDEQHLATTSCY